jgi:hypothetical protein
MKPATKHLRDAVKHIDGAWVRVFPSGTAAWAGAERNRASCMAVRAALEARGYRCECRGKPGTEGEYIVDVILEPGHSLVSGAA